jgi:hypothetical protein
MDIKLNEHFDIELDDRQDVPTVTGKEDFQQRLTIAVTDYFYNIVGDLDQKQILSLLNLEASRVVEAVEGVEELLGTEVQYSETSPNTIEIIAFYKNDEDYIREISE